MYICLFSNYDHDHKIHDHGHSHNGHSHLPIEILNSKENTLKTSLKGLLIILGLSVHECFEGLAIGLMKDESGVW